MFRHVSRLMGSTSLLLAATILFAAPASAASPPRRVWQASLGSGHGSATVTLTPWLSGTVDVNLKGLTPNATYRAIIYKGTCASPTTVATLNNVRTDADGAATKTTIVPSSRGSIIWNSAARATLAIRIAGGTERYCALLRYGIATKIQISKYGINLPIVTQPPGSYPYCNVAMYFPEMSQPGEAGPTFIYAHARTGMFLPLLTASRTNNGAAMIGATVKVWTSDSKLHTYTITRVLRNQYVFPSYNPSTEQLWLQTSEGPHGTRHKLIIFAKPVSVEPATYAASHPTAHIVRCGF